MTPQFSVTSEHGVQEDSDPYHPNALAAATLDAAIRLAEAEDAEEGVFEEDVFEEEEEEEEEISGGDLHAEVVAHGTAKGAPDPAAVAHAPRTPAPRAQRSGPGGDDAAAARDAEPRSSKRGAPPASPSDSERGRRAAKEAALHALHIMAEHHQM
jgi:hypothetical protein